MIFSMKLDNALISAAMRLEFAVGVWIDDRISHGLELNCWSCFANQYLSAPGEGIGQRGMDEMREELGDLAANMCWRELFGRLCRDRGYEPVFTKKNANGESDTNARVGFAGPRIQVAPKQKAAAKPSQRIDYAAIAAATRAMTNTPKRGGGMGDLS